MEEGLNIDGAMATLQVRAFSHYMVSATVTISS